jgi:hypothetical protein
LHFQQTGKTFLRLIPNLLAFPPGQIDSYRLESNR